MPAGYSGTPLAKKLGIKPSARVLLREAPDNFESQLDGLPDDVTIARALRGATPFDVIVAFHTRANAIPADLERLKPRLAQTGGLWLAWPKKSSGVETDVTDSVVRAAGLDAGLVDNKVCAIDQTWSGLRFVYRVRDRKK